MNMSTDLANRVTISAIVNVYQSSVATVRAAFAAIHAAEGRLNVAVTLGMHDSAIHVRVSCHHHQSWDDPKDTLDAIRRDTWRAIVERLEIRRMLSVKRAEELNKHLERGTLPEITEDSVADFAQFYLDNLGAMLEESVREVFEFLRPRLGTRVHDLKTNTELEIGPRVILGYMVDMGYCGTYRVKYSCDAELTALENVFLALDGKGSILKSYQSALRTAIDATRHDVGSGETDYFAFRCHRNGRLHLRFKRLDLLKKLNQAAGGMRLRPAEEAA